VLVAVLIVFKLFIFREGLRKVVVLVEGGGSITIFYYLTCEFKSAFQFMLDV